MPTEADLPYLTFALAQEIATFPSFTYLVTASDVRKYTLVTGDHNALYQRYVPPGFAGVFGRTSYLQHHRMPPGGVLLRQDIEWHRPALVDEALTIQARLVDWEDIDGKLSLTFKTTATQSGGIVSTIGLKARWPR